MSFAIDVAIYRLSTALKQVFGEETRMRLENEIEEREHDKETDWRLCSEETYHR